MYESPQPRLIDQAKNPLLGLALPALPRTRRRAEEIAIATNTELVQMVDGRIVFVRPSRAPSEGSHGFQDIGGVEPPKAGA